jgi:3-oxoacyl-[acyl-carrier-protein] synthase-3
LLPTNACLLQDKAGLSKTCGALDFNLGCSGYIYGLGLASGLIESGQAKYVLLITSDTYSKLIHEKDKSNKTIFGDGASVTLITSKPNEDCFRAYINNFVYGTDGSGFNFLIAKNRAMKRELERSFDVYNEYGEFVRNDDFLYMNGKEIFQFTAFEVPPLINKLLTDNSLIKEDIDMFIFHQANRYMLDFLRKRCQISEEKFFVSMEDVGNTVSSTIPIALKRAVNQKRIIPKNRVILAGFGVGLSIGATIIFFE